jgi:signal recognition particle subunit SRP19
VSDLWQEVQDFEFMSFLYMMASAWSPGKKHSERERWICIYPAYINNKKTLAEGRRIPKDKAVENPTHQEIRDVLSAAGMKAEVENKLYSIEREAKSFYTMVGSESS